MLSHDEPMLTNLPGTTDQPSESLGHWDFPVAMVQMTVAGDCTDGAIGLWVTGSEESLVVGGTESERLVSPRTAFH
jgi:hypothetical protein